MFSFKMETNYHCCRQYQMENAMAVVLIYLYLLYILCMDYRHKKQYKHPHIFIIHNLI